MPYTLPTYHDKKVPYIDFTCFDPLTNKMRRKKYHLARIKSKTKRRQYAAEFIARLTERLRMGWNVWAEVEDTRKMTLIITALDKYENYLKRASEVGTMKEKTVYGYISYLNIFREWLENLPIKVIYCYQLTTPLLSDFLDYVLIDREATPRTRNNYRVWLSTMFVWLMEKGYSSANSAEKVRVLKEEEVKRDALTKEQLQKLKTHLSENNKYFLLACMWQYYTFIRPNELAHVRLADISIKEQKVFVSGEVSKNRRNGMVALNKHLLRMMIELEIFKYPSEHYLFGKDFRPSSERADSRIFRDYWVKVRKALKWDKTCQFYSLKNSGIRDLANSEGIVVARDQARHSDITTTNKYLKGKDLTVHEEVKTFKGEL